MNLMVGWIDGSDGWFGGGESKAEEVGFWPTIAGELSYGGIAVV